MPSDVAAPQPLVFNRDTLKTIAAESPRHAFLAYLFERRRLQLLEQLAAASAESPDNARATGVADILGAHSTLVDPVLFATALAIHLGAGEEAQQFFDAWLAGNPIDDVDERFVEVEKLVAPDRLTDILDVADELLAELCAYALGSELLPERRARMGEREQRAAWEFFSAIDEGAEGFHVKYRARWTAWLLLNPVLNLIHEGPMFPFDGGLDARKSLRDSTMFQHGFGANTRQQNYLKRLEYELDRAKAATNAEAAGASPERRRGLLQNVRVLQKLVDRARQLYLFNPTEIDAHAMEETILAELSAADKPTTEEG